MGVEGGTKGLVWLFNDEDRDVGSSLMIFDVATVIDDELFRGEPIEIPFNRHFFSSS